MTSQPNILTKVTPRGNRLLFGAQALGLCAFLLGCEPDAAGPVVEVAFYTRRSKDGRPLDPRKEFAAGELVRASVRLNRNVLPIGSGDGWHIQWLRPDRHRRYLKSMSPVVRGESPTLRSSIRLHARHGSGKYTLQLYQHRLLVHEEHFTVHVP